MPTRRFAATALTIVIAALAVFSYAMRDPGPTAVLPSPGETYEEKIDSPSPSATEIANRAFTADPTLCPSFTPRTTLQNGNGWRVLTNRALCLNAEYPDGWNVHVSPTGVSFTEPTGHEGEYFATAFPGELTAEVHLRFSAAGDWATEPAGDFRRIGATVYVQETPMHAHVASYRALLIDRILVDMNAHAPEGDTARKRIVEGVLRSIEVRRATETLRMSAYVP